MTAQEDLTAFMAEERVPGFYSALTDEEKLARNVIYTELKINVDIEAKQRTDFYAAREAARAEVSEAQMALMTAFNTDWSALEETLTIPAE